MEAIIQKAKGGELKMTGIVNFENKGTVPWKPIK